MEKNIFKSFFLGLICEMDEKTEGMFTEGGNMTLHGVKNSGFRLDLTRSSHPAHGTSVTLSTSPDLLGLVHL